MTLFLQATMQGLALGAVYSLVAIGLVLILTLGLTIYGLASFQDDGQLEGLESSKGWRKFTSGI